MKSHNDESNYSPFQKCFIEHERILFKPFLEHTIEKGKFLYLNQRVLEDEYV
jgi:hypothetical protein